VVHRDMSGDMRYANVPRDPLETHLALPNRVLGGGPCPCTAPARAGALSCAAILLCDLSPSAARALTSPREAGPLLASAHRATLITEDARSSPCVFQERDRNKSVLTSPNITKEGQKDREYFPTKSFQLLL
jgi:hypothetical protein